MTIKSIIRSALNLPLGWFHLRVSRITPSGPDKDNYRHFMPTCFERLCHARKLGFAPRVILDGGAFRGEFSKQMSQVFPGAQLVIVEPNPHVQAAIRENTAHINPPPLYCQAALADAPGKAAFNIWGEPEEAVGASLLGHVRGAADHAIEVTTDSIDNLMGRLGLRPDLIKLDLQGAELLALKGAGQALQTAEMVVVEFGCLAAYHDRTTPRQLMDVLYDRDYCLYDIVDCHYRPYDGALTGGDFIFVKASSPLKSFKGWSQP